MNPTDQPEHTPASTPENTPAPEQAAPPATPAPDPIPVHTPSPPPAPTPVPAAPSAPAPQSNELSAEVEAEIAEAMKEMDAAVSVPGGDKPAGDKGAKKIRGPRVVQGGREHRKGVVVSVGPDDVFIEFGPKELGVAPRPAFEKAGELPNAGDTIEVVVERFDASESLFVCSKPGEVVKADWEMLEPGQVVEARVVSVNKGGLEMEVAKHRAFMPASHIDTRRIEDLSVFVGEKMPCKVLRIDRMGRGNITLSRRDVLKEEQKELASKLQDTLKEGDTVTGKVNKIMPFGAFVDMGGCDGLLHISDLTHDRVSKVEDVLKEGDTIEVMIVKLDWEKGRHSLGLKQLQADPFEAATTQIAEGEELSGTVTKMLDFGAFVQIAPGVEGLVHISELDWKRVEKTSDVVQPGKVVKVKVLKVDPDTRKISLSIKQTTERPVQKGGGPRGGKGGRPEKDTRSAEEILKETPKLRRMREQAKQSNKGAAKSGLGNVGGLGVGLGDLGKFVQD